MELTINFNQKTNSMKYIFSILIILLTITNSFAQWSKGKGKGYYKLSTWYLKSDQHFGTISGVTDDNVTTKQFNVSFYGEYGITDKIDIITYAPIFARSVRDNDVSRATGETVLEGDAINSIGDIDLGARYAFFKKGNWAADVKLLLGLPTGNKSGGRDGSLQTGDGEFNQYLSASIGYSTKLYNLPVYAKYYIGYNNRSEGFSDEFRTGFESGINLFNNKFWLIGRLNILRSTNNGSLNATNSSGSIFANNIEYTSYGFEAAYYITKKLGVSVGYDSAFDGKIIAANPSYNAGIFLDIK